MLYYLIVKRGYWHIERALMVKVAILLGCAIAMGALLIGLAGLLETQLAITSPLLMRVSALAGLVLAGVLTFFGLAHVTGAAKLGEMKRMLTRKPMPDQGAS